MNQKVKKIKNMKKLLKKDIDSLKIIVVLFLLSINLYAQQSCTFKDAIKNSIQGYAYKKNNENLDMKAVLNEKKTDFLGFIGTNYKRFRVTFTSIKKIDNKHYSVEGFSTVMNKNKRNFKGTFTLVSHYELTEPSLDTLDKGDKEGFSTFLYVLKENEEESATGIFEGNMAVQWFKEKGKQPGYSSLFDYGDPSGNYLFLGTWTSYKTGKKQRCHWGQNRIPCSGDLDIGASDFSPDPKYRKYGWEDFH